MYKYKTKDGNDLVIVGFGTTVNGEITTNKPIENPNLVLVSAPESTATPGYINGVVPQNAQSAPAPVQPSTPSESAELKSTPESETQL